MLLGTSGPVVVFWWMLVGHALCDGPLQTGPLASMKSSPDLSKSLVGLIGHGLIHGGAVALATGRVEFGVLEAAAHIIIDGLKRLGCYGMKLDQALHLLCKAAWLFLLFSP